MKSFDSVRPLFIFLVCRCNFFTTSFCASSLRQSPAKPTLLYQHMAPNDSMNAEWLWESKMRQMATEALVPVFYLDPDTSPEIYDNCNLNNTQSRGFVDPEKALKKLLRRYQKSISSDSEDATPTSAEERHASRKRLADLVLGTSLMRLRHYHDLQVSSDNDGKDIEPIVGLTQDLAASMSLNTRIETVRAMVDRHAEYMVQEHHSTNCTNTFINVDSKFKTISDQISTIYSQPKFFVDMLIEQYGVKASEEMAAIFNKPGPIFLRRNAIKCHSDELLCKRLCDEDSIRAIPLSGQKLGRGTSLVYPEGCIKMIVDVSSPLKKSIWSLKAWKDGWFEVQDAGSQLIADAAELESGDTIVDYCAGNGGKTFAFASQMHYIQENSDNKRKGHIIAHDIVEERLRQVQGSLRRVGIVNDSEQTVPAWLTIKTTLDPDVILEREMADVVLVDAPCSSTGVLRRRPSQRFKLKQEEIKERFPSLQSSILADASRLVKEGGKLVYATCSICHHENENVVRAFEDQDDFNKKWEPWNFSQLDDTNSQENNDLIQNGLHNCRALLPNLHDCDGFFIARWRRKHKVEKP